MALPVVFDKILLIAFICIDIAVILYFFYWNRLVGYLLTLILRFLYSDRDASSIWVEIGSIHFSLLAGRILLKDVRYHSSNQTVRIVKGQISWRYWIRDPTSEEDFGTAPNWSGVGEGSEKSLGRQQNCRIQVSFQGFEWFLYNRTPAYENIIAQMNCDALSRPSTPTTTATHTTINHPLSLPPILAFLPRAASTPATLQRLFAWFRRQLPYLDPKDLLPIGIQVVKGAIICGNRATQSLLVAEFAQADGRFGVTQSRSKLDLYKQIISLNFKRPLIRLVENDEYHESMVTTGERVYLHMAGYPSPAEPMYSYNFFHRLWKRLKLHSQLFSPRSRRRPSPARDTKAKKSIDDEAPLGADFASWEYAIERKILEAPELEMTYYTDVVGEVPHPMHENEGDDEDASHARSRERRNRSSNELDVGNGDLDPEWGIDLVVRDGILRYGPWADRQRAELQRMFFPSAYHDQQKTRRLKPGDKRMWTHLQVFMELRGDTSLQIPFREASKNWLWDGKTRYPRPRKRDAADIHLSVGDMSAITYIMPMVVSEKGYESRLEVHLDSPVITSSLNNIRLVTAESCRIRGELPAPIKWNDERTWTIGVSFRQPILFLLRDHINMFTDLMRDWVSGPPTQYHLFVPTVYVFELEMHHYELNFYLNDQNIIDKPLVRDENALLTLHGHRLKSEVHIPSNRYRPGSTKVSFSVDIPHPDVRLSLPRWHTHSMFSPNDGNSIAHTGNCSINGSYLYYADLREDNIEQLKLNFNLHRSALHAIGWSIRFFMVMRENYLGSFTHFSTLYEYLNRRSQGLPAGDPLFLKYRPGTFNTMQVEMGVNIDHLQIVLPAGLPGREKCDSQEHSGSEVDLGSCVVLDMPDLQLQFRMHDYYMEMSLNVNTVLGYVEESHPHTAKFRAISGRQETIIIEGLDITANRLFGPQPRTATYLCIWEIKLGDIKSLLSPKELLILGAAGNAFRLNFVDAPNIPAAQYIAPPDPDITFVRLAVNSVEATVRFDHVACAVSLPAGLRVKSNDLAGDLYRKVTGVVVPEVSAKLLISATQDPSTWLEAAHIDLDLYLDLYSSPLGWREAAKAQADFVAKEDSLTDRVKLMLQDLKLQGSVFPSSRTLYRNGLYLPQPICGASLFQRRDVPQMADVPNVEAPASSDSEVEEGITEADRDARIVSMRSMTPQPKRTQNTDDENMSSGDESDDDDEDDDSESMDSLWSDLEDEPGRQLLSHYSRLTRRYVTRFHTGPSGWSQGAFTMSHECRLWEYPDTHRHGGFHHGMPSVSCKDKGEIVPDEETSITLLRVASKKGIQVRITPLVLPGLEHVEKVMTATMLCHELCLDAILANHLSNFKKPQGLKSTLFDVTLSCVHIKAIQSDLQHMHEHTKEFQDSHINTILAQFLVKGVQLSGGMIEQEYRESMPVIDLHMSDISLSFFAIPAAKNAPFKKLPLAVALSTFGAHVYENAYEIESSDFSIEMDYLGPECALAVAFAVAQNAKDLGRTLKAWKSRSSISTTDVIYDVLKASVGRDIVDPLSLIQPLYLVQSGRPHELRTDASFRFLFHLRHCLRTADIKPGNSLPASLEAMAPMIEGRLSSLAMDIEESYISALSPILPDFKRPIHSLASLGYSFAKSLSIHLLNSTVSIYNDTHTSSSTFSVSSLEISTGLRNLDIMPLQFGKGASFSQTSLHTNRGSRAMKLILSAGVGDVTFTIVPDMLNFAQQIVRTQKLYPPATHRSKCKVQPSSTTNSHEDGGSFRKPVDAFSIDVLLRLRHLKIEAVAETLIVVYGMTGSDVLLSALSPSLRPSDASFNATVITREIFLRAISVADRSQRRDGVLASFDLNGTRVNVRCHRELSSAVKIQTAFGVDKVHLNVPKSALRLYQFVEDWRADFFPGIEAMIQALLSEMKDRPASSPVSTKSAAIHPIIHVYGRCSSIEMSLQVMRGTWLSWEIRDANVFANSSQKTVGIRADHQILSITSRSASLPSQRHPRVKLELPSIAVRCKQDETSLSILTLVDFFHVKIKPSHWDALLTVQQKFGKDFNDLVSLMEQTRLKRLSSSVKKVPTSSSKMLSLNSILKINGFRIELEALSSIAILECEDIGGQLSSHNTQAGFFKLSDLALSLAPRAAADTDRRNRSAFVIIDFRADISGRKPTGYHVKVALTKIHAVMQPSSIGQLGDFIDHLQAEIMKRKEERAHELAEFKEKTRSVMKTFEAKSSEAEPRETTSLWEKLIIDFRVEDVGIAFPLTLSQELELPRTGSGDSTAVRAFLFSVTSVTFSSQRGESGTATMNGFSFQFVPNFRQSAPADFSGENHFTNNRLIYPEMRAQIHLDRRGSARMVQIDAKVNGFILDLDASIPDYVFSLVDVYREGQERLARFNASIPWASEPSRESIQLEKQYTVLPTSNVLGSLTFFSGALRLHSSTAPRMKKRRPSRSFYDQYDDLISDDDAEIFRVPVVSVWAEFRATPALHKVARGSMDTVPSTLVFKSTIHSSENTFRPTILPFWTDVVRQIEKRLRQASKSKSRQSTRTLQLLDRDSITEPQTPLSTSDPISSMQVSFSLRIDKSRLQLTCQPDVNVIAGLNWDSGGFMVTVSPGARKATFTGNVAGLTIGLRHGFLSEDCVRIDARNLAFCANFIKLEPGNEIESAVSFISVILDTEFSGLARFSRLQDVLCFKAVWLDRIPVLHTSSGPMNRKPSFSAQSTSTQTSAQLAQSQNNLITVVLIRVRRIRLEVDLGQSISTITLDLTQGLLRTKLTEAAKEVSLTVAGVVVNAQGNVAGKMEVPDCVFRTIRRTASDDSGIARLLELSMTSGPLTLVLESDSEQLVRYHAEPLKIDIFDDWSASSPSNSTLLPIIKQRPLQLSFLVSGTEITVVITVVALPRLISYMNKFKANLDAQRQGASFESKTFRVAQTPKPDNPLSAVANAMIHSARSRIKDVATSVGGLDYLVTQRISLKLELLRLVVFPRKMNDHDLARFVGKDVQATLDRVIAAEALTSTRNLKLAFTSIVISKCSQLSMVANAVDTRAWLDELLSHSVENVIAGLPSMTMHMLSEEEIQTPSDVEDVPSSATGNVICPKPRKVLLYDFSSQVNHSAEGKKDNENIYITLNVGLYNWLTVLRKSFTREMTQVRDVEDWRSGPGSASAVTSPTVSVAGSPQLQDNAVQPTRASTVASAVSVSGPISLPLADKKEGSAKSTSIHPPVLGSNIVSEPKESSSPPPPPSTQAGSSSITNTQTNQPRRSSISTSSSSENGIIYKVRNRRIERLTLRQLGEATPDVMHPFFTRTAGFNLEDSLPQYVNEYATTPLEEIMEVLLKVYSRQLLTGMANKPA